MKTKHILTRDVDEDQIEVNITVEYTFHPFCRGATDGRFGPPIEPDEPAHLEIDGATDSGGNTIELTDDEKNDIGAEIWEAMQDHRERVDDDNRMRHKRFINADRDYTSDLD